MVDFSKLLEQDDEAALRNYAARLPVTEVDPQTGLIVRNIVPELKLPVQGQHEYIPGSGDTRKFQWFPSVAQGAGNVKAIMEEGTADWETIKDRLFGSKTGKSVKTLGAKVKVEPDATFAERFQMWPEKMVRSGASLPFDVMANPGMFGGPVSDDPYAKSPYQQTIERTQDLSGLAAGGSVVSAVKPKAGTLAARLTEVIEAPALKLAEDAEAGSAISASKNSLANRLNEHLNEGKMSMPEILQQQRASEGYEAAIRDPETKKLYTGMWHEEVLDKIAKDKGIPKDQLPTNLKKGYVDYDGKFWTEQQLENRSRSRTAMFRADDIVGTGLASVAPRFYSTLERTVENAKSNKAAPDQWLGTIKNTPGITAEELNHMKLPEWLDEQKAAGKKSISKEEIQQFIKDNKVELQETWKGNTPNSKRLKEINDKLVAMIDFYTKPFEGTAEEALKRREEIDALKAEREKLNKTEQTRFKSYQLPGGENYRELLMSVKDNPAKLKRIEEISNEISKIKNEIDRALKNEDLKPQLTKEQYSALKERQYALATEKMDLEQSFTTEHWPGNRNIVVHSRMNDRFIPDENGPSVNPTQRNKSAQELIKDWGYTNEQWKKLTQEQRNKILDKHENDLGPKGYNTLHAEEIQSDWLQKGNSEGFRLPLKEKNKLEPEFNRIDEKIINSGDESVMANPDLKEAIKSAVAKKIITEAEAKTYLRYADSERYGAVPDAPFKGTWSDLMVKRLIRQAVEEGKDAISWTPGQAQIDRYPGVQEHFSKVEYNPKTQDFKAYNKRGEVAVTKQLNQSELVNYIGKENTDKLLSTPVKKVTTSKMSKDFKTQLEETTENHVLENADMAVGGEFHKKFYDEILVNKVNAIAKKFGGRVEEKEIPKTFKSGSLNERTADALDAISEAMGKEGKEKKQKIWVLKLTPEMKKHAMEKGFSMFESGLPLPSQTGNEQQKYRLVPVSHNPFSSRLM